MLMSRPGRVSVTLWTAPIQPPVQQTPQRPEGCTQLELFRSSQFGHDSIRVGKCGKDKMSFIQPRDVYRFPNVSYTSVSQPPGRGPVPGPGINYTGPREVLLEFVILVF